MYFTLDNFVNDYTINIFTDASIIHHPNGITSGCYGAIVTRNKEIIDSDYRICTNSTSNNSEIKAIRSGVNLAIKWRNLLNYPITINLFSDSQVSILGIRDRIFSWRNKKDNLVGYGNIPIKNQSVYIDIINLVINSGLLINFYHQKGHVSIQNYEKMNKAIHVFVSSNGVRDGVDPEFIKFISIMNNKVDNYSRKLLYKVNDWSKFNKRDAFEFYPFNHTNKLKLYNELQGSKYYL